MALASHFLITFLLFCILYASIASAFRNDASRRRASSRAVLQKLMQQAKTSAKSFAADDDDDDDGPQIAYAFPYIDFWDYEYRDEYIQNKYYEKVTLAGIKLTSDQDAPQIFVSMPRWKPDSHVAVPATLARISTRLVNVTDAEGHITGQKNETRLEAYPSWEWNNVRNYGQPGFEANVSTTLFSVLGFEIDQQDRMWILDQGKISGKNALPGAIKLVIWDTVKNELVTTYQFSEQDASLSRSFLNDLVIDTNDDIAYISDSGIPSDESGEKDLKPGLLMFDLQSRLVRRFFDSTVQTLEDPNYWVHVNGKACLSAAPMRTGADGIALSCDLDRLYWTPLSSNHLYAIDTDSLRMYKPDSPFLHQRIVDLGNKIEASDGLACSAHGKLYITGIESSSLYTADEQGELSRIVAAGEAAVPFNTSKIMQKVLQDNSSMIWPDTLGFDTNGNAWVVANNLCDFLERPSLDISKPNFMIWKVPVNDYSYIWGCVKSTRSFGWLEWTLIFTGLAILAGSIVAIVVTTRLLDFRAARKRLEEHRRGSYRTLN